MAEFKCLIHIISPTHLVAAICAVKTLHPEESVKVTVLINHPYLPSETMEETVKIINILSNSFAIIDRIVLITKDDTAKLLKSENLSDVIEKLTKMIGLDYFDEFYYTVDFVIDIFKYLCLAYPAAQRICFGDVFGNVYEKDYVMGLLSVEDINRNSILRIKNYLGTIYGKVKSIIYQSVKGDIRSDVGLYEHKLPSGNNFYIAHKSVLILPVDQSGNFLNKLELIVCNRQLFDHILSQFILNSNLLQEYINSLIVKYVTKKIYIILTDNFAEGNFIDFDHEIDMWCSVIRENIPLGSVVLIKSHPNEVLPRNDRIIKKLSTDYGVVALDAKYRRYPIELWKKLVMSSEVVCMSYPMLSLKYIYDIDVINPMTDEFIEKWFPPWTWNSFKNSCRLYSEPFARLKYWDGKSILWSGQ